MYGFARRVDIYLINGNYMKYRPQIDGLRAIAVISVILFHAGFDFIPGGYIGVDVFFVISGFLITTILINQIDSKQFSFINFYERRVRRILPSYIVVTISTYIFALFILTPFDLKELSQSMSASAIFLTNFYFYLKTGYFDTSAELKPLLHLWSLSVEEQYYVIFPPLLLALFYFGRRTVFAALFIILIGSLSLSEWASYFNPNANYYLLPYRAWELMIGSLGAVYIYYSGEKRSNIIATISFTAVILSFFLFDSEMRFPSLLTLIPVMGTLLVLMYAEKSTVIAKLLSLKVLVFIGLCSYSAYLWHQPVISLAKHYYLEELTDFEISIVIIFIFLLSHLTWKYVEQPFRKSSTYFSTPSKIFAWSVIFLLAIFVIGLSGHYSKGFPSRNPDLLRLAQNGGLDFECTGLDIHSPSCRTSQKPQILVWGDSYGMHYVNALANAFPELGVQQATMGACPPVPNYQNSKRTDMLSCADHNELVIAFLRSSENNLRYIFLSSSIEFTDPSVSSHFIILINELKGLGKTPIIVSPAVHFPQAEACILKNLRGLIKQDECVFEFSEGQNSERFSGEQYLAETLGIDYVDVSEFMCIEKKCGLFKDRLLLLRDIGHFSNEIQDLLGNFLKRKIQPLVK